MIRDGDSLTEIALVWFIYFFPAMLVAVTNLFNHRDPYWKKRSIKAATYVNLFFGWTVIGWFWALRFVWYRPEGLTPLSPGPGSQSPTGQMPSPSPPQLNASPAPATCTLCGGSGCVSCGACRGQGGEWQQPQTQSGVAQFVPCGYCLRSGTISCSSCGGTGHL